MFRLVFFVLFAAAVFAVILHVSIWWTLVPLALFAIAAFTVGGLKTRCPACHKGLKLGATACHHCGRSTVSPPA